MKETAPPLEGETPELATDSASAPGEPIVIPKGVYWIFTALGGSKTISMATIAYANRVFNVNLWSESADLQSTWEVDTYYNNTGLYTIKNGKDNALALAKHKDNNNIITEPSPPFGPLSDDRNIWSFKDAGDGFVYIVSFANPQSVMEVVEANTVDGTHISLHPVHGATHQKFRMIKIRNL